MGHRYGPVNHLIDLVFRGAINPDKVFDLVLPLDQVAEAYRAMDERRAIKTLLRPYTAIELEALGERAPPGRAPPTKLSRFFQDRAYC
jgi:hypothetical protein